MNFLISCFRIIWLRDSDELLQIEAQPLEWVGDWWLHSRNKKTFCGLVESTWLRPLPEMFCKCLCGSRQTSTHLCQSLKMSDQAHLRSTSGSGLYFNSIHTVFFLIIPHYPGGVKWWERSRSLFGSLNILWKICLKHFSSGHHTHCGSDCLIYS